MLVATVIGIMIAIVVGVNLLPMITESVEEATKDSEDMPAAASALLDILPIVFVAVLILGAVAWIGGSGLSFSKKSKSKDYHFAGGSYSGKTLLDTIEKEEEVSLEKEEKEETEVLDISRTPTETTEVPGIPKAPFSNGKSFRKPPWAK